MFWSYTAAAVLAQVPGSHVPSEALTHREAFGGGPDDAPGLCGGSWPSGFAWRAVGEEGSPSDPCSGRFGDARGIEPRCWKCAPPRYNLDARSLVSLFIFLWSNELVIAIGICVVAGACASWFFAPPERRRSIHESHRAVMTGVENAFCCHLGSLALGSAIIAAVQLVRWSLFCLERQATARKNKVMVSILRCVECFIWMFEKCLKFMSKKAYIQIALMGTPFCESAKASFYLLARNPLNFALLSMFGNLLRWIGVSFIVVASALVGFLCLNLMDPQTPPVAPMAAFVLLAYMVGSAFMNVFGLAADTILHCLLASKEMGLSDERLPKQLRSLREVRLPAAGQGRAVEDAAQSQGENHE
mmetsp:Transcript_36700/g.97813  ORF Transcript_36700/g.97813 Transcript_36700/m.97813 type:complete len:359 (-) Transcript_36700:85-1161(-)